jgi:hypothetical protein
MDNNYKVVEIADEAIPTYVRPDEYYFIDGEFKLADECPNEYKDKIVALETTVAEQEEFIANLLEAQVELTYEVSLLELNNTK